jgi:hypothetical protein
MDLYSVVIYKIFYNDSFDDWLAGCSTQHKIQYKTFLEATSGGLRLVTVRFSATLYRIFSARLVLIVSFLQILGAQ